MTDDFVTHVAPMPWAPDVAETGGREALKKWISGGYRDLIPDMQNSADVGPIADEHYMVVRWKVEGTYNGGFPGASPDAACGEVLSLARHRPIEDGKFAEYWLNVNSSSFMQQIGVQVPRWHNGHTPRVRATRARSERFALPWRGAVQLPFIPNLNLDIVTCIDCQVDHPPRTTHRTRPERNRHVQRSQRRALRTMERPVERRPQPHRTDHRRELRGQLAPLSGPDRPVPRPPAAQRLDQRHPRPLPDLSFVLDVGPSPTSSTWSCGGRRAAPTAAASPAPSLNAVGREVTFTGTDILRIADGKFAEYWGDADSLLFIQQLGVREVPAYTQQG